MKNQELAKIFYEMADIFELENVQWKPRAYRKAAQSLESLGEDVSDIYKEGGIKGLMRIPGVGEGLAKKISEYLEKGYMLEY
ncbi:MAG: helix-hairpin-helix domain-containing protein, partial [Nanoarchaeota archaeon]